MNRVLYSRLPKNHLILPDLLKDYKVRRSGYKGELNTDYRLSFLPEKEYLIFRDLRLFDNPWYFQIDTLLLTPRFIIVIESKNYAGTLYFEKDSEQMIQSKNNQEIAYDNPVQQVKKQVWHLKRWLDDLEFNIPPIVSLVVISNPSTIIKTNEPNLFRHVVKGDIMLNRVEQINTFYSKEFYSEKDIKKISKYLIKKHVYLHTDILKAFSVSKEDIITGVQCPSCSKFGMERKNRIWVCPFCLYHSKNAHYQGVYDFFLLNPPKITNREFREFLNISSIRTANNLLSAMHLPYTGNKKGRVYHMPDNIETFFHLKD